MKLEDWLKDRAGLSGKKLQVTLSGCEMNMVESVDELRELLDENDQFEKTFPQSMIRTALLKALKKDPHEQSGEEASGRIVQANEDVISR